MQLVMHQKAKTPSTLLHVDGILVGITKFVVPKEDYSAAAASVEVSSVLSPQATVVAIIAAKARAKRDLNAFITSLHSIVYYC